MKGTHEDYLGSKSKAWNTPEITWPLGLLYCHRIDPRSRAGVAATAHAVINLNIASVDEKPWMRCSHLRFYSPLVYG